MVPPSIPRRQAVGLAGLGVLGAGLAGCGARSASSAGLAGSASDDDVVAQARGQLARRATLVGQVMRRHPSLRRRLRPLLRLHHQHEQLLAGGPAAAALAPLAAPGDPTAALADVLRQERALTGDLAALAVRAGSGTLGRALAGMAAGTAQRVALLTGAEPAA